MAVAITGAPKGGVMNLVVSRDGDSLKVEWKNPTYLTDEERSDRATWVDSFMYFDGMNGSVTRPRTSTMIWAYELPADQKDHPTLLYTAADGYWIRGIDMHTDYTKPFDRKRYHPIKDGYTVTNVSVLCFPGNGLYVDWRRWENDRNYVLSLIPGSQPRYADYAIYKPRDPKVVDAGVDSAGKIEFSITADEGRDHYDRYDTRYCILRRDSFSASYKNFAVVKAWANSTDTEISVDTDVKDLQSLTPGQWIEVKCQAFSRGMAGNGTTVEKSHVFAYPAQAVITGIAVSSVSPTGVITVKVNTRESTYAPVDTIQLQRIKNSTLSDATEVAYSSDWSDVSNAIDNGSSSGLSDTVADAMPDRGKHTWYRIKSTRDGLTVYSTPVEAKALFRAAPTAEDDSVTIVSVESNEYGDALYVTLGWPNDDSTGTEVSYSEYDDAWESTNQPTTVNVTWKDDQPRASGYANTARLTIYNVYEGTPYYIKARRYLEGEETTSYGLYSTPVDAQYPIAPASKPCDVMLNAPDYAERGKDVEVSWTFQSNVEQTSWALYQVQGDGSRTLLASGDDALGSAKVSAEKLSNYRESVDLLVSMTTGSEWADSEKKTVRFSDRPVIKATVQSPLRVQPMLVYVSSDTGDDSLVVRVFAEGVSTELPDRVVTQVEGEVVWSAAIDPQWVYNEADSTYYAVVELPTGVAFYDLANYRLSVTAVNNTTGLVSEEQIADFQVRWIHQAHIPSKATAIEGHHDAKSARIIPEKPDNFEQGDVFDVYRSTPDGNYLIAEGLQYGSVVDDRFAPYSKTVPLSYRIVNRTPDGDISWIDVPYNINGYSMRFDWGNGRYVELPYNLEQDDSYEKDFEARRHLDGSVSGYWNAGVQKSASLSTELVKLADPEQQALVRELGKYAGPVFVRTPDGGAYQANVNVSGLERSYKDLTMSASFDAKEVVMTSAFKVGPGDVIFLQTDDSEPEYARTQILSWSQMPPAVGSEYELNELPSGDVRVRMTTSFDSYSDRHVLETSVSGRAVKVTGMSQDARAAINNAPEGTQFLVIAEYNIEA